MRAAYLITISLACSSSAPPVTPPTASAAPVTDIQTLLDTARIALEPRTSGPDCIADVESQCAEACRQGQGPTVGVACALAADALRAAGDDAGAIEHYLSACGHGDPEGCAEVALLKLDGKIALAGPISCADCQQSWRLEAHPYLLLDGACNAGSLVACRRGSAHLTARVEAGKPDGRDQPLDGMTVDGMTEVAAAWLQHACLYLRDIPSCLESDNHRMACVLGSAEGCRIAPEPTAAQIAAEEANQRNRLAEQAAAEARAQSDRTAWDEAHRADRQETTLVDSECTYIDDYMCRAFVRAEIKKPGNENIDFDEVVEVCIRTPETRHMHALCLRSRCGARYKACILHDSVGSDFSRCARLADSCGVR